MAMKRLPWTLTLLLVLSALTVATVIAQGSTPTDDEVNAIAKQMYCPVCENTPLDVCPTQACAQWRDEIRLRLAQGWSEGQIKEYFAESYGIRVLAEPPRQGLNWLVYIVPPVAFIAGAYILFRAFRSWQALSKQVEVEEDMLGDDSDTDPYLERLEEELKKRG